MVDLGAVGERGDDEDDDPHGTSMEVPRKSFGTFGSAVSAVPYLSLCVTGRGESMGSHGEKLWLGG